MTYGKLLFHVVGRKEKRAFPQCVNHCASFYVPNSTRSISILYEESVSAISSQGHTGDQVQSQDLTLALPDFSLTFDSLAASVVSGWPE